MKKTTLYLSTATLLITLSLAASLTTHADTTPVIQNTQSTASFVAGTLNLDNVPTFDFGENHPIQTQGQYYNVTATTTAAVPSDSYGNNVPQQNGPYAEVTDLTGSNDGWTLTVQQETDFQNTAQTAVLSGAAITYNATGATNLSQGVTAPSALGTNETLVPMVTGTGAGTSNNNYAGPALVAQASGANGQGADTNIISFGAGGSGLKTNGAAGATSVDGLVGTDATSDNSVYLFVPASANALAQTYTTQLTWTLTSGTSVTVQ